MMRVQLFNPSVHQYTGVNYRMNPPLGLPIIASVLRQAGHNCEVADLEALRVTPPQLAEAFQQQSAAWPDAVGFTVLTSSVRGCKDSIAALREIGYEGKILVGGPHATLFPEEPLTWGADGVVTGECEGNVVNIIETVLAGGEKAIFSGEPLPIDQIPTPDWNRHSPSPSAYDGNCPMLVSPQSISMWSRGCPGACTFCCNPVFRWQPIRYRPPERIAAEMEDLKRRHIRSVFVYDDELIGGRHPNSWMSEIADRIGDLGLVWKAQGRCSRRHISPGLMGNIYRAGGRVIMWGVESFSQKVLNAMQKGTTVADIWHSLRVAKEAGVQNWLFTMIGNYGEGEEEIGETAKALRQAWREGLVDYRQTTIVTALPGTKLYDQQKAEGWYVQNPEGGPQMIQIYQNTPWLQGLRMVYWLHVFDEVCPVGQQGRFAA